MPDRPARIRRRMGPDERAAARAEWAAIGRALLDDAGDGELSIPDVAALSLRALALVGRIARDRQDADDTPDAEEG